MSSQTTNLNLTKPGLDDARDITVLNGNFDIIDADSGTKATAINARALKTEAVKNITRSGATFTATRCDNTTFTFDQKDYSQISRGSSAGLAPGLPSGSGTTKYLREDGSWQVPPNTTYNDVTTSTHGLMTAADKTKLNGIANNANNYSLPLAASGTRGGVQIGYTQSGKKYPVQLSSEKMYVEVPWTDTTYNDATTSTHGLMSTSDKTKLNGIANNANNYSLPMAANGTRGGVQLGYTTSGKNYAVQASSEKLYVNVPWEDTTYNDASTSAHGLMSAADKTKLNGIATGANNYSLPLSASGTRGGIQIGYSQNGKNYPVQLSSEKAYVNVPWTDTTYEDATTTTHGLMSTADKTKLDKYKSTTKSNYGIKFKFFRNEAGQVIVTAQGTASSNIASGAAFNPGDAIASEYRPAVSAWTSNGIKIDTSGYVWATDPIASGTTKVMSMVYGGND